MTKRVRFVVDVPDYKRSSELATLVEKITGLMWQEVSGVCVGFVIERDGG